MAEYVDKEIHKKELKTCLSYLVDEYIDNDRRGNFQVNFSCGKCSNINGLGSFRVDDLLKMAKDKKKA